LFLKIFSVHHGPKSDQTAQNKSCLIKLNCLKIEFKNDIKEIK